MRDLIWLQYVPRQPPSIARPDYANEQNILSPQNLVFLAFLSRKIDYPDVFTYIDDNVSPYPFLCL